jgi:hypothetical protein
VNGKLIKMGGEKPLTAEQILRREQLAAQMIAIMQAHFTRSDPVPVKELPLIRRVLAAS